MPYNRNEEHYDHPIIFDHQLPTGHIIKQCPGILSFQPSNKTMYLRHVVKNESQEFDLVKEVSVSWVAGLRVEQDASGNRIFICTEPVVFEDIIWVKKT